MVPVFPPQSLLCSPQSVFASTCYDLLGSKRERGTGDGGGQIKAFGDLSPDFLVDDFHQPSFLGHQLVQHVEVQDLLRHDGDPIDGSSCRETAGKEAWESERK